MLLQLANEREIVLGGEYCHLHQVAAQLPDLTHCAALESLRLSFPEMLLALDGPGWSNLTNKVRHLGHLLCSAGFYFSAALDFPL